MKRIVKSIFFMIIFQCILLGSIHVLWRAFGNLDFVSDYILHPDYQPSNVDGVFSMDIVNIFLIVGEKGGQWLVFLYAV